MTKRDVVKQAIAHKDSGIVPYCIQFTAEGYAKVQDYYGRKHSGEELGNFVSEIVCPWWQWSGISRYGAAGPYAGAEAPDFLPAARGTGSYVVFEEQLKRIKETTDCYVLVLIYGSYFEKAWEARGAENWLSDLVIHRGFAERLLAHILRKNLVMLENILTYEEIDGILVGGDWGSQNGLLVSPQLWREMVAPGEQKEYDLIKSAGKDVWIHSCGNIESIVPDLIEMGVDVINPVQPEAMDIRKLKRVYGDRVTFWGGINTQQVLPFGTPDEVREEVRRVISFMSKGGGYIASPAQYVQGDVPALNIIALLEEVRRGAGLSN